MKKYLLISLISMLIVSKSYAGDYVTNFGELTNVNPPKFAHFNSEIDAMQYIQSFGYIGNHLVLIDTKHTSYYGGEETKVYAIPKDQLKFKGTLIHQGCGWDGDESCLDPEPDLCKQYASYFRYDEKDCSQQIIKSTDWEFYLIHQDPSFGKINRTADVYLKKTYTFEITYLDENKKTLKADLPYELIRQDKWNCTPNEGDKFTNIYQHGALIPELLNKDGDCAYRETDSYGQQLKVSVTNMLDQFDTNYPSCTFGFDGDPVDMQSGKLHEKVTDYLFKFPLPIVINRYYSNNHWSFSYSRHLEFKDSGNQVVLYFDDGSKQNYIKINNQYISPVKNGSSLSFISNNYYFRHPSGLIDKFDEQGRLVSSQANNGLRINIEYKEGLKVISDNFNHSINVTLDKSLVKSLDVGFGHSIQYNYDSLGNLIEVIYPNHTKLTYSYKISGDKSYLQSVKSGDVVISDWNYNDSGSVSSNKVVR